ncbi:MAG: hypothetical protein ACHQU0_03345 [Candidatus Paceibacteria bacterium]
MNEQNNRENPAPQERRLLPFVVEFVKFAGMFAVIIAAALVTLHAASAAMP